MKVVERYLISGFHEQPPRVTTRSPIYFGAYKQAFSGRSLLELLHYRPLHFNMKIGTFRLWPTFG